LSRDSKRPLRRLSAASLGLGLAALCLSQIGNAFTYIGHSFLSVPGVTGDWKGRQHRGWISIESHYWTERPPLPEIRRDAGLTFTGPDAPREGANVLNIAVAKTNPAVRTLMAACRRGLVIPEMTYAESADRARHTQEFGERPPSVPEYYEYKLVNTRLACPVVAGAPEQGFILRFESIRWLNYAAGERPPASLADPASLAVPRLSGRSRTFAVTWFAEAADIADDQCPTFNSKPSESDYYALMPPGLAAGTRAALAAKGGVSQEVMPYRGPAQLNVCYLPGIVPDPGLAAPRSHVGRGLNLDGQEGTRRHPDYVSPEGESGIDNALFGIEGCIKGFQRKGIIPAVLNQGRIDGGKAILIDIGGIDDETNDDQVVVTIHYSEDPLVKDSAGKLVLPDYTYRLSRNPIYTHYAARLDGRITDGIITTAPVPSLAVNQGSSAGILFQQARLRLRIMPDGSLRGLLGGYFDWRSYATSVTRRATTWENGAGYQCPAIYNAVRRAADGLKDPVTGQFTAISVAFDIEGVAAFLPPGDRVRLTGRVTDPR
jgi:hypothetical protein